MTRHKMRKMKEKTDRLKERKIQNMLSLNVLPEVYISYNSRNMASIKRNDNIQQAL